ncbi:MAG: hypothetical protein QW356_08350 [Candidatus Hadarchaeales archaeon]
MNEIKMMGETGESGTVQSTTFDQKVRFTREEILRKVEEVPYWVSIHPLAPWHRHPREG